MRVLSRSRASRARAILALAFSAAAVAACNAIWGIDSATLGDGDGGSDGHAETSRSDTGAPDSPPPGDAMGPDTSPSDANPDAVSDAPMSSFFDGHCVTGGMPTTLALAPYDPQYLAIDEGGVYWTNFNASSLGVLRFGSAPVVAYTWDGGPDYPQGVAAAGGRVVWVALGDVLECTATDCKDAHVIAKNEFSSFSVVANSSTAFWNTSTGLVSCDLPDCLGMPKQVVASGNVGNLAIDSTYVYWVNGSAEIDSCTATGAAMPQIAIVGEDGVEWVTVENGTMYWSSFEGIRACPLVDGACAGGVASTFVGTLNTVGRLVADDKNLYFAEPGSGTLNRVSLDGGAPDGAGVTSLYATAQLGGLAVGESCLFWTNEGDAGAVVAGPK